MITITSDKIKSFSQKSYNEFLEEVNIHQLSCSCGIRGHLIKHAYYNRSIKTPNGLTILRILRVICKSCNTTHAIFPTEIVPFSQIPLLDHISIIQTYHLHESFEPIMMENEFIDESNIRYIISQYLRHWKERMVAYSLSITDDINLLVTRCLTIFKRQFMQIKCTPNILFLRPT